MINALDGQRSTARRILADSLVLQRYGKKPIA